MRYAKVDGASNLEKVRQYLPSNYKAIDVKNEDSDHVLIYGNDDHGWTLDGYVIPRLGSGLIAAKEV